MSVLDYFVSVLVLTELLLPEAKITRKHTCSIANLDNTSPILENYNGERNNNNSKRNT